MKSFTNEGLTIEDQMVFIKSFQIALQSLGRESCWCIKKRNHSVFQGFATHKRFGISYRGRDARPLLLELSGIESESQKEIIVRKAHCTSKYCLNPTHYYWGDRANVALENIKKKNYNLNTKIINKIRKEHKTGLNSTELAKKYKLKYQTVRRICNNEIYETLKEEKQNAKIWRNIEILSENLIMDYPKEERNFKEKYHMIKNLKCHWHQESETEHIGNFGVQGECLDCMEKIKKGRCSIDVTNFEFKWSCQIREFWSKVDIKNEDECWPWLGNTRKNGAESTARLPSPMHSDPYQSAPRVAFWTSRGYTGKYRIFSRKSCKRFCCNPLHLTIRELKCCPVPKKIETIKLHHDNIVDFYKKKKNSNEKQ